VELLDEREDTVGLAGALRRLGVATVGDLAALPRAAVVDRFGPMGGLAHELVGGQDTPLRPREPVERVVEWLELSDAAQGAQLEAALRLLVDRLLARGERRGRSVRSAVLSAGLVGGGSWRERVVFRAPLADPSRMLLVLTAKLALVPSPAARLELAVERFGPPSGEQRSLLDQGAGAREAALRDALEQARAAAGPDALLRVVSVEPASRLPERRYAYTPARR
jgi:protein ImuB